jgi:hypothetical protein
MQKWSGPWLSSPATALDKHNRRDPSNADVFDIAIGRIVASEVESTFLRAFRKKFDVSFAGVGLDDAIQTDQIVRRAPRVLNAHKDIPAPIHGDHAVTANLAIIRLTNPT